MGLLGRLGLAFVVAVAGLWLAAHGHVELKLDADKLGGLLFLLAVFFAYRAVKAHFDGKDAA